MLTTCSSNSFSLDLLSAPLVVFPRVYIDMLSFYNFLLSPLVTYLFSFSFLFFPPHMYSNIREKHNRKDKLCFAAGEIGYFYRLKKITQKIAYTLSAAGLYYKWYVSSSFQQNVAWLYISMNDSWLSWMKIGKCASHLRHAIHLASHCKSSMTKSV